MTQRDIWNDWKAPDDLKECVCLFWEIVDTVETSDSGRDFKPNKLEITSCRVWDTHRLKKIIPRMKELCNEGGDVSPPCS